MDTLQLEAEMTVTSPALTALGVEGPFTMRSTGGTAKIIPCTDPLNVQIAAAQASGERQFCIPPFQHVLTAPIVITANDFDLVGYGAELIPPSGAEAIKVGPAALPVRYVNLRGFAIQGSGSAGIKIEGCTELLCERLKITGCTDAITAHDSYRCRLHCCYLKGNTKRGLFADKVVNAWQLSGCVLAQNETGVQFNGWCDGNQIIGCTIEGNSLAGVRVTRTLTNGYYSQHRGLHIAGNHFESGPSLQSAKYIDIEYGDGVLVQGGFMNATDTFIYARGAGRVRDVWCHSGKFDLGDGWGSPDVNPAQGVPVTIGI